MKIVRAVTDGQVQQVIALAQAYVTWVIAAVREQYPDIDLTEFIAEHDYTNMSAKFPGEHVPPHGCLLLAVDADGEAGGCVALGRLSRAVCEMRTLYVHPVYRGQRMGRSLAEAILQEARDIGYTHMRLDTLAFMHSALSLYHSLGFREITPYRHIPGAIQQHVRFLELDLYP